MQREALFYRFLGILKLFLWQMLYYSTPCSLIQCRWWCKKFTYFNISKFDHPFCFLKLSIETLIQDALIFYATLRNSHKTLLFIFLSRFIMEKRMGPQGPRGGFTIPKNPIILPYCLMTNKRLGLGWF